MPVAASSSSGVGGSPTGTDRRDVGLVVLGHADPEAVQTRAGRAPGR